MVVYKIKNHKKESLYWSSFCNHVLEKRLFIDPSNNILAVSSHLKIQNEWPQIVLEWKASIFISFIPKRKRYHHHHLINKPFIAYKFNWALQKGNKIQQWLIKLWENFVVFASPPQRIADAENFCNEITSQNLDTLNFKRFKILPLACSHRQRNAKTNFFRSDFILPLHKNINVGQVYRYFVKFFYLSSTQKLAKATITFFLLNCNLFSQ